MQGADPADASTGAAGDKAGRDYVGGLSPDGLKGRRIGILRSMFGTKPEHEEVNKVMAQALETMRASGAELVEIDAPDLDAGKVGPGTDVQKYEFKALLNAYLASIPNAPAKTVSDIVALGRIHKASTESFLKGADAVTNGTSDPDYKARLQRIAEVRAATDHVFSENRLDALVYPLQRRLVVPLAELNQADRNGILASVTGLPALDIPAGFSTPTREAPLGVPVGMDLLGPAWSEPMLLQIGYAFEKAANLRKPPAATPTR
jgi:Asp-tRNA(Asn)/Glu-tRNA(Gln) amidotransferase A subunit family amidase